MKIILIGLASSYTEGLTYQDNLLANQLRDDGHDVIVISNCHKYSSGKLVETQEEDKILNNGIRLIRMKYKNILGEFVSSKIRAVRGLYSFLTLEKPDIIFNHGVQSYELLTISKYKKNNPSVKFFADNHADYYNSVNNLFSKYILHGIIYKEIIQKSLPYMDKVFYIDIMGKHLLEDVYNVPKKIMEFYPLGGIVPTEETRLEKRERIRNELDIKKNEILLIHSGKMNKLKRTEDILESFIQVSSSNIKLIIIGLIGEEIKRNVEKLINSDDRIKYLGWKENNDLFDYLCASDLYIQPGSMSATMQNALCCGSAVAIYPNESYKDFLKEDMVFYIETNNDIKQLLIEISLDQTELDNKKDKGFSFARKNLDYKILATRLYF